MSRQRAAAALAVVAALAAVAPAAAKEPLLPNLVNYAPADVYVEPAWNRSGFRLRFESKFLNIGRGPLRVRGSRSTAEGRFMPALQIVHYDDGSTVRTRRGTRLEFREHGIDARHPAHWHFDDLVRYELRSARTLRPVRTTSAKGWCLNDEYNPEIGYPGQLPTPVFVGGCGTGQGAQTAIELGLSIGWATEYPGWLAGQSIELAGVRAGQYWLVNRVNFRHRLLEMSTADNASAVLVEIGTPAGGPPTARVLRECGVFTTRRGRVGCGPEPPLEPPSFTSPEPPAS